MIILAVLTILAIATIGILIGRKVNEPPEPTDIPPGVWITNSPEWGYNYVFDDHSGGGIGYLTRKAAIRAAWAEYNRKNKKGIFDA